MQVDLLRSLPKTKRNIAGRAAAKDEETVLIAKLYDEDYFDGDRRYGYGGYQYDGRWNPVVDDIVDHYQLDYGDRVLDVGCAKGFLVKDMLDHSLQAYGLDISYYALLHAHPDARGHLYHGSADALPFADKRFDLALSINTLHNLPRDRLLVALRELSRVSHRQFIQVDSYLTPDQRQAFEAWVLTAEFHDYPAGWLKLFNEAGYTGDYDWTIV